MVQKNRSISPFRNIQENKIELPFFPLTYPFVDALSSNSSSFIDNPTAFPHNFASFSVTTHCGFDMSIQNCTKMLYFTVLRSLESIDHQGLSTGLVDLPMDMMPSVAFPFSFSPPVALFLLVFSAPTKCEIRFK